MTYNKSIQSHQEHVHMHTNALMHTHTHTHTKTYIAEERSEVPTTDVPNLFLPHSLMLMLPPILL